MDGIIIINKQKGCTSHDVVHKIKKIYNTKVGHTGTLDPNATGVLPILLGKGTKLSKYLIDHNKEYEATIKLGIKTDTADIEGEIVENKKVQKEKLNTENINQALKDFIGKQYQTPPMYSAIKVNGKKLYEYARRGENVDIKPREIEIYDIELLKVNKEEEEIIFRVKCSKGTYIRTLCENIAEKLDTVGYMKDLNRTEVGIFNIKDAVIIDDLQNDPESIKIITIEDLFKQKEIIRLNNRKIEYLLNGVKITQNLKDGIYRIYDEENKFIGIGIVEKKLLKIDLRA